MQEGTATLESCYIVLFLKLNIDFGVAQWYSTCLAWTRPWVPPPGCPQK
jgi:hypothetical protein